MNRKKSDISPLVAAKMRPTRLPPRPMRSTSPAQPNLRVCYGGVDPLPPSGAAPAEDSSATRTDVAEESLSNLHDLLTELEHAIRRCLNLRRIPPRTRADLQSRIDAALDAIDHMRRAAEASGSANAPDAGVGAILAELRSGGASSVERASLSELHSVVSTAASHVTQRIKQIKALRTERTGTSPQAVVANENADAANRATGDADFSDAISRMTGADVLLNSVCAPGAHLTLKRGRSLPRPPEKH